MGSTIQDCFKMAQMEWQAVKTEQFDQCYSISIFWTPYSMVKPLCSNFWIITANCLGT